MTTASSSASATTARCPMRRSRNSRGCPSAPSRTGCSGRGRHYEIFCQETSYRGVRMNESAAHAWDVQPPSKEELEGDRCLELILDECDMASATPPWEPGLTVRVWLRGPSPPGKSGGLGP